MGWVGPAISAGGSILGGALGGKGSGGNKPPKWLRRSAAALGAAGQQLGQTPYTPYGGERVAGFSPDTLAAFNMIRSNVGAATPAYQSAINASQGLTGFQTGPIQARTADVNQWAGQDLTPYLNPFTQQVIDANSADQQQAYLEADNALKAQGASANAFGNNRFGLAQGQLAADSVRDQSLMSAQLRSQGFNTAAGLLSQDVERQNQFALANQGAGITADQMNLQGQLGSAAVRGNAASQLGWLGQGFQGSLANDAKALGGVGSARQALNQQNLDVGYGNYIDQTRTYPSQQLNWWSSSLQPGISANSQNQPSQGGGLLGALGGAQMGSQVGSSIYDWWKGRNTQVGLTPQMIAAANTQLNGLGF